MDAVFRAELNMILHGNYEVTGYSSHPMVAVDTGSSARRRQATELHEFVHSELSDMSTYGPFQQLLATASTPAAAADHAARTPRGPAIAEPQTLCP
jgi:hypothetical protein